MADDLDRARERRDERESDYARRLADELFGPPMEPAFRRAVERQNAKPPAPVFACTAESIDRGMFWMDHGHYPGEEPEAGAH